MSKSTCELVRKGKADRKAKASLEFFYMGRPHYYCYGYIDRMNDEPLDECRRCKSYIDNAEADRKLLNE